MNHARPTIESLECRKLLSAVAMNTYEQYMLELLNRARANPGAEAARYGIDLNEGLAAGTLDDTPSQPLAPNGFLTSAARDHGAWLLANGTFSHTGEGGSSPGDRIEAAGYEFAFPSGSSENLAVKLNTNSLPLTTGIVDDNHRDLFVDEDIAGRGHRKSILRDIMAEVGVGYQDSTSFNYAGRTWNAQLATQNYAFTRGDSFLTGVAYTDGVTDDTFYTPGEQLAGVTVTATPTGGNDVYTTTTAAAGGYSLQVPDGTYTVTATGGSIGGGLGGTVTYTDVVVDGVNVKRDFTPDLATTSNGNGSGNGGGTNVLPGWAEFRGETLLVGGTDGADDIILVAGNKSFDVVRNGERVNILYANATGIEIYAKDGADVVDANIPIGVYVNGGAGNDILAGGFGADVLTGGDGDDQLNGRGGDDRLNGNAGRDVLLGTGGNDRLFGGSGRDQILGGSGNDQLMGENGDDLLLGGPGDDVLLGGNHDDSLYGQNGNDLLHGQAGRDLLNGNLGADLFDGGDDFDIASYEDRTGDVYVSPTSEYDRTTGNDGESGENDHVLDNVEMIVGGAGNDTLAGTAHGGAQLYGLAGNDVLYAYNDLFDYLNGGDGFDEAFADVTDQFVELEGVSHFPG